MKQLLILSLVLLPFFAFSQEDKVSFAIEGTIGMSNNLVTNDGTVPSNVDSIFSKLEKGTLGYDIGGIVSFNLGENLELQTGVKVLELGDKIVNNDLRWGSDFIGFDAEGNAILVASPDNPTKIKFINKSLYLEIPIRLNYRLKGKLNAFKISLGQSPTFNIFNRRKYIQYFEDREKEGISENVSTNFRKINFNTQLGIVWEKRLKNRNMFYLSPNARIQNFGRSEVADLNRRYFFYGITMGIKI